MNIPLCLMWRMKCWKADKIILRFDGIDTLASVWLNGEKIGTAENMHRIYEFDVTDRLCSSKNELI